MTTPFYDLTENRGCSLAHHVQPWVVANPLSYIRRPLCLTFSWLLGKDGPSSLLGSGRALLKLEISSPSVEWRALLNFFSFLSTPSTGYLLCPLQMGLFLSEWPKGGLCLLEHKISTEYSFSEVNRCLIIGSLDDGFSWRLSLFMPTCLLSFAVFNSGLNWKCCIDTDIQSRLLESNKGIVGLGMMVSFYRRQKAFL